MPCPIAFVFSGSHEGRMLADTCKTLGVGRAAGREEMSEMTAVWGGIMMVNSLWSLCEGKPPELESSACLHVPPVKKSCLSN